MDDRISLEEADDIARWIAAEGGEWNNIDQNVRRGYDLGIYRAGLSLCRFCGRPIVDMANDEVYHGDLYSAGDYDLMGDATNHVSAAWRSLCGDCYLLPGEQVARLEERRQSEHEFLRDARASRADHEAIDATVDRLVDAVMSQPGRAGK